VLELLQAFPEVAAAYLEMLREEGELREPVSDSPE
jgi:hypothetical protein